MPLGLLVMRSTSTEGRAETAATIAGVNVRAKRQGHAASDAEGVVVAVLVKEGVNAGCGSTLEY